MRGANDDRTAESVLVEHVEWLRSLARRMVGDAHEADEIAQEALVVALEDGPEDVSRVRPWLASVLRNLWRSRLRSGARREARELATARRDEPPSTDDLVAELATFQELAQLVADLDEPYRTVLLLRFYEDLPPREIARRLDVPVATVNSRIARALTQLRARFAERRGGRALAFAALAPLVDPPVSLAPLSLGGLLVKGKLVAAAGLAGLAALAFVWSRTHAGDTASLASVAVAHDLHSPARPPAELATSTGGAARAEVASSEPIAEPERAPAATVTSTRVRGRAFGPSGEPLPGLGLRWSDSDAVAGTSGALGAFEVERSGDRGTLVASDAGWTTVRSGVWSARSTIEPVVVAARTVELAGVVLDARGTPLTGARVTLSLPISFATRFDASLEASASREWNATSSAAGRFRFSDAPSIPGAVLKTALEGWALDVTPQPEHGDGALTIVLSRPAAPLAGALRGRVVAPNGAPIEGARVFVGLASTTSDDEGRFALDLARASTSDRAVAVKAGFRPARLERPRAPEGSDTGWPAEVELVLGGPALSIRGVVVDAKGAPREGVLVWIADPTPAGAIGMMPASLESLMAGAIVPPEALESEANLPPEDGDSFFDHTMTSEKPRPSAFWHFTKSAANGTFELGGLDDREYAVRAMDRRTLLATTTERVRGGERDAKLSLAGPKVHARVAGRVVDDAGTPVAGVRIGVQREAYGVRSRVFGGHVYVSSRTPRETVITDDDGRFELADVPVDDVELAITSDQIVPRQLALSGAPDPESLRVEVALRCAFEVRIVTSGLLVERIGLRDADGEPLELMRIDEEHSNSWTRVPIVEGRSGVISASSAARTLDLYAQGQIVKSVPIRLQSGAPQSIDL